MKKENVKLIVVDDYFYHAMKNFDKETQEEIEKKKICYFLEGIDNIEVIHWEDIEDIPEIKKYFEPQEFEMYWDGANWIIREK